MNSMIIIAIIAIIVIGAAGYMFMRVGTDVLTVPDTSGTGIELDETPATVASEQASSATGDLADEFSSADNLELLEP
jgi:hypothetical protein